MHHYFAITHAAVVGNFIVCKSTTSVAGFFCEGTMKETDSCGRGVNVKEKE